MFYCLFFSEYTSCFVCMFFFFNDTASTEIYTYLHTLSLHDALPICFAPNIEALAGLRFLQALGGSAGMVVTRAMVRDRFEPQEMAKILSATVAVMGIAPIIAPTLGGLIFRSFGWQAIFYVLAGSGVRSEEHTSELQPLMRNSYAVFCLT